LYDVDNVYEDAYMTLRKENILSVESNEDKSYIHIIYRFPNGYGASVVREEYTLPFSHKKYSSYTNNDKEWEVAVIKFFGSSDKDYHITYDTEITGDVLGYQTDEMVNEILSKIENL
jgi:hypothetical protein